MHGLLSERFLRRFAGSLRHRHNLPAVRTDGIREEPVDKDICGADSHNSDETCLKEAETRLEVNGCDNTKSSVI